MKFKTLLIGIIMGLMVSYGGELIRYNPSKKCIEYSTSAGRSWLIRNNHAFGNVKCMIVYGKELLLCSDKGIYYSTNSGRSWLIRTSSYKDFVDMQDCGKEIIASTADGRTYFSTTSGRSWLRR